MYTVTRQIQYPDGDAVVEVSYGGIDYTNPDALSEKYAGEFQEFSDPREAVETAIEICVQWRKDGRKDAKVGIGSTSGCTMPFEPTTFKEARKWAKKEYASLEKCPQCGSILEEGETKWSAGMVLKDGMFISDSEWVYCSEQCAEKNYIYMEKEG